MKGWGRSIHSGMYTRVVAFSLPAADIKLQHTLCVSEVVIVFHTKDLQVILFALYTVYYITCIDFHQVLFNL